MKNLLAVLSSEGKKRVRERECGERERESVMKGQIIRIKG